MIKKFFSTLLITAMICAPVSLSAQITIGSGNAPSEWSLLYLDAAEQSKGLHLPRLTTVERNALFDPEAENLPAAGLMIFNTYPIPCLEFWNGKRWVSLCESDAITQPSPVSHWVPEGGTHTFTLGAATGGTGTFTYQWQSSPDGITGWVDIPNETGQHLTIPVFTENTHRFYRRVAILGNPSTTHYSNVAEITVWARYNVDMPNTFTQNMHDAGRHFQWGTCGGVVHHFPATGPLTPGTWGIEQYRALFTDANTPCPAGWRLPTYAEFRMLTGPNGPFESWVTNWNGMGVNGALFGFAPNNWLFLPAAGSRGFASPSNVLSDNPNTGATYWTGTVPWWGWEWINGAPSGESVETVYVWNFSPGFMNHNNSSVIVTRPIRCVVR